VAWIKADRGSDSDSTSNKKALMIANGHFWVPMKLINCKKDQDFGCGPYL